MSSASCSNCIAWENVGVETVLCSFASGAGGAYSFNGPIMDKAGNLYRRDYVYKVGSISEGVFEVSPSKNGWTQKVIYDNGVNTGNPDGGGITMDAAGDIFGVYWTTFTPSGAFELSPNGKGGWNSKVIHTFDQNIFAIGVPVLDKSGSLYGTGQGTSNPGMVYKLSPKTDGQWTLKNLYAFKGGTDGSNPYAGIEFDAAGKHLRHRGYRRQVQPGNCFRASSWQEQLPREDSVEFQW
jgi:hypothetical protein